MNRHAWFGDNSFVGSSWRRLVWHLVFPVLTGMVWAGIANSGQSLFAQQQIPAQQKQPLEYIESSSPAAGGGVVTSVYVPGRGAPTYNFQTETSLRQNNSPARLASNSRTQGQSVLSPGPVGQPGVVTTSGLGVPVDWNRSLRPNCAGCGTTGTQPGIIPQPPQSLPNAASFPPTLTSVSRPGTLFNQVPVPPQGQSTYTPIINRRGLPPNTYAGQGIFGSPKLYVTDQPIRNFFRYIIIP